ncbi:MAG: MOSC N-terminal beta barrel domain-containing protein [Planctomycetaceae bacterium]
MPTLDRITIYPVKSLDGVVIDEARVLDAGGLEHDRRWQLMDLDGRLLNAKRTPVFHAIRAEFDLASAVGPAVPGAANQVTLAVDPEAIRVAAVPGVARLAGLAAGTFPLVPGPDGPCDWLAEALGERVLLLERRDGGFPDDREAPGPTVVSTASLEEVGRWFGLGLDEVRRRFRANLEVGGCDAFWEDTLASPARLDRGPRCSTSRPTRRSIPMRTCRRPSRGSFRSARCGSGRRTSAAGARCRPGTVALGPSRSTSATSSRPGGGGACGPTSTRPRGARSTAWRSTRPHSEPGTRVTPCGSATRCGAGGEPPPASVTEAATGSSASDRSSAEPARPAERSPGRRCEPWRCG